MEDFIELNKSRKLSELTIARRDKNSTVPDGLSKLDMRINQLELDDDGNTLIKLIFKLDYFPETSNDIYTLFLIHDILVFDKNQVLLKDPTGSLSVGYMATHYIESGERLFRELKDQASKMRLPIKGNNRITQAEAEAQIEIIMNNNT